MPEGFPITIPQEFVNDSTVKLVKWCVEEGQEVQEGLPIAEIETSKAVVELAASTGGHIRRQRNVGDELRIGEIIAYISQNGNMVNSGVAGTLSRSMQAQEPPDTLPPGTHFSKKALELIRAKSLDPLEFAGRGLVRESDITEYMRKKKDGPSPLSAAHFALADIPPDRISMPAGWNDPGCGKVEEQFLVRLLKERETFADLSSHEKCQAYRKHGAVIGANVQLAPGSVLVARHIVLGDRVQIGANSSIECRERFIAGKMSSFRAGLSVRGGAVVIGENIFGGSRVQIGGGGNGDPQSVLSVGNDTYIGDDVFINLCRPVVIGREVYLTQRSILVTHNVGHSILEGYENRFAPIVLEDMAQVGMSSTIYAGTRIGHGSIVMSNSYVVSAIPPGKLAAGIPARVLRDATRTLDRKRQMQIVETMIHDFGELLNRKGHKVDAFQDRNSIGFYFEEKGKRFRLIFAANAGMTDLDTPDDDEVVLWTFEGFPDVKPQNCVLIDLLAKTVSGQGGIFVETTREFLRKRGIRLQPGPWRYCGGFL